MDPLPPDPYETLGIERDASLSVIKNAFKKLVLKCRPALKAAKQDELERVQLAYKLLTDEGQKAQYDNRTWLAAERAEREDFIAFALKLFDEVRVAELARSGLHCHRQRL
jgi:curved DNA-binding protein CbpA